MLDFVRISSRNKRNNVVEVYPKFVLNPDTKDLMIRGGDFYAVWNEDTGLWDTSEKSVINQIDKAIDIYVKGMTVPDTATVVPLYMWDGDSGSIDKWHKYVQKQMRDRYENLDERIIFSNTEIKKDDYVSKRLPYPLEEGSIESYSELIGALYDESEMDKLEWAIGAIISGDAKHIQKFEVLYGSAGTGKSTILNIIEMLFNGYTSTFNAKELSSANSSFALESFKTNPLVSIQHDGDLSRIEDNTKLNSIVSHETMEVNAKYTRLYQAKFNTFLFMGTNKPVKITDAKSGIIRRLIDVKPSGRKLPYRKYKSLMGKIKFELSGIAWHCLKKYQEMGESYYDSYIPLEMIASTNDFYDFIQYYYDDFVEKDMVTVAEAWQKYKEYCEFAHAYQLPLRVMRVELQNYFKEYQDRAEIDGKRVRALYSGFRKEKFEKEPEVAQVEEAHVVENWLELREGPSLFDEIGKDWPAQECKAVDGSPKQSWRYVHSVLKELNTHELHWVKPPEEVNLICADFDLRNSKGEKDLELNIQAANEWPKTYAEVSNSGGGLHLYYFYVGDVSLLSQIYKEHIEIKTFKGGSSLRRRLSLCNDIPISTISSGLPLKGEKKVTNKEGIKNEKMLRTLIMRNLNKEYHPDTTSSVDFIKYLLDMAYESGIAYDVSDMQNDILMFAMKSTNQADRCVKTVGEMKFMSEKPEEVVKDNEATVKDSRIIFFDCEVYQNLFVIVWKYQGANTCVHMVNPKSWEVEELFHYKLVGFNNRKYDNHILWAAATGYSNLQLYNLSQRMINEHSGFFREAYNISYTDIYDFCTEKMGLKKWEIKLGIHHQEMGIPWDQPVPADMVDTVVEYCENDVRATEAVFNARKGDFVARQIQVDLVRLLHGDEIKVSVNDTTNTLSKRIIFGRNENPQSVFNYRDLSKPVGSDQYDRYRALFGDRYKFRVFDDEGLPQYRDFIPGEELPKGWSILPFFKGYTFANGESWYLGEKIGEGGRNYSEPGGYKNVWDGDVSSMHPHSIISECLFGPEYTRIFEEIVQARVAVKHRDFETAGKLLNGALKPYLTDELAADLAQALKIVINSIYGLTSASFKNEFRDERNVDNIVAKRGAVVMTLLKKEIQKIGYKVCHIKTDSIKIPDADQKIQDFIVKFGREFGYEFETEAVFKKFVLLNDAAYIGRTDKGEWVTKADQFKKEKQPYLFKTLFSKEDYTFDDYCETKSVSKGAMYLDMNEDLGEPVDDQLEKEAKKLAKLIDKKTKLYLHEYPGAGALLGEMVNEDPDVCRQKDICEALEAEVPKHHNYVFVGRVGRFTPIVAGGGGGKLYRMDNGKYYAVGGTSDYRWLESEHVKKYGKFDLIDKSYYRHLVDEAVNDICDALKKTVGDDVGIEWMFYDEPSIRDDFMNIPEGVGEELPWDE